MAIKIYIKTVFLLIIANCLFNYSTLIRLNTVKTAYALSAASSPSGIALADKTESSPLSAPGRIKISLASAIKRALSNQGNILKAEHIISERMDLKKAAYAGLLPDIAVNAGGIWTRTKNGYPVFASANGMRELIGQVGLTVPIFDPKIYGEISLAGNNLKVAEYRLRLARLFTAARITQYFYGLILLKDEIKIERKALYGAKKILTAAKIGYKAGSLPRFDVVQTELMAAGLQTNLEILKSKVKSFERMFLMEIFYGNVHTAKLFLLIPVPESAGLYRRIPPLNNLISKAVKKQPLIKIARAEIESAKASVSISKAGKLPSIQGGGAYGEDTVNSFDAPDLGWQFFVILNIPIYNFGLHKDYIDAANERLMALKSAESAVKLSVKKRLTIDYGRAAASKKKIYGAKILVKKSYEAFKMTKEGYLAGAFNALELQEAQNNWIKSRLELAKAINEFYLAISQLDIDMGIIPSGDGKL
ncbi:MAG: TolC family protein [Deltaproteobacteria bacterium]|nr:TolC family protein [Deltaproteobacteria bacterium]